MNGEAETKNCPACAETIKAAAKVCPFCRRPQNRRWFLSDHDSYSIGALMFFVAAMFLALWFFTMGRQYSPEKNQIKVLSANFGMEVSGHETNLIASGVLTNTSRFTWRVGSLEVRFLDAAGKTVDVSHGGSTYQELVVPPHSDCAFHVALSPQKSVPSHVSSKVIVTEASDPNFWFGN